MQIVADLQLHSKHSRAVSQKMDLFELARWSSRKGIQLVATGDWQHPIWFREIMTNLEEVTDGIYTLKKRPVELKHDVYFFLSTEISSIYMQGGKQRRVHNLVFSPSIKTCAAVIKALQARGANLMSDGRPIVGISSKDLLEMLLSIDENILLIPAHAWTPWFAIFGSKSGFDSIEECFGNLTKYVYAIETGLSSDPIMNWQIKELETKTILSFSDAHSGPKLGREATVFASIGETNELFNYQDIIGAIKQTSKSYKVGYTIEFFPEEGKYHWSGHRACNIRYNPQEVKENGIICPVCHRPLTIGVENRVNDLSSKILSKNDLLFIRNSSGLTFVYDKEKKRRPFVSLIPLLEVTTELQGGSMVKGQRLYEKLTDEVGTEFDILLRKSYDELKQVGGEELAKAIRIIREREVFVDPGYDGVFGKVEIFKNHEKNQSKEAQATDTQQSTLF